MEPGAEKACLYWILPALMFQGGMSAHIASSLAQGKVTGIRAGGSARQDCSH